MKEFILDLLASRLSHDQWEWLQNALAIRATKASSILDNYTAASRRLGKRALQLDAAERHKLRQLNPILTMDHWGADEAARALILLSLAQHDRNNYLSIALQCYELGDSREQQSWLRSLSILPDGGHFLQTAIDSCRTNIIPLFEAIACENPYPSVHFPELNFNQMVLKCLFNRIALSRIVGLESRLNPELARMADHYASELRAAGREVPRDIHLAHEPSSSRRELQ
jgi:hypothetical protein